MAARLSSTPNTSNQLIRKVQELLWLFHQQHTCRHTPSWRHNPESHHIELEWTIGMHQTLRASKLCQAPATLFFTTRSACWDQETSPSILVQPRTDAARGWGDGEPSGTRRLTVLRFYSFHSVYLFLFLPGCYSVSPCMMRIIHCSYRNIQGQRLVILTIPEGSQGHLASL